MQAMSRNLREVPKRRSKIANDRTCETPVLRPRGNDLWPGPRSQYGLNPAKPGIHSGEEIGPRPNTSLLYEACSSLPEAVRSSETSLALFRNASPGLRHGYSDVRLHNSSFARSDMEPDRSPHTHHAHRQQ